MFKSIFGISPSVVACSLQWPWFSFILNFISTFMFCFYMAVTSCFWFTISVTFMLFYFVLSNPVIKKIINKNVYSVFVLHGVVLKICTSFLSFLGYSILYVKHEFLQVTGGDSMCPSLSWETRIKGFFICCGIGIIISILVSFFILTVFLCAKLF